jgi:hypothetical protein
MERATVKTILLIIGSAIGGILLFIVAVWGYLIYKINAGESLPEVSVSTRPRERGETVSVPPEIRERFLGTQAVTSGDFPGRNKNLAAGPGRIAGTVASGGKPVKGMRLRLALNGSVMSEWAETDAAGRYAVPVPYGRYRVDGYELDRAAADALLAGKNDSPQNHQYGSDGIFVVAEGKTGRGPDFAYVDPVRKKAPLGEASLSKPVVLEWEAYPGASQYRVQMSELQDPRGFGPTRQVFECCDLPTTSGTSFNLSERGVTLKKGYGYYVSISALDGSGKMLADSTGGRFKPDFVATD